MIDWLIELKTGNGSSSMELSVPLRIEVAAL